MAKSNSSNAVRTAKKLHKHNPKLFYAIVAVVIIIAIVVGVLYVVRPDLFLGKMPSTEGQLVVHFIDVGQGDCIYIQFPSGKDMLIDAGSTSKTENSLVFVDGESASSSSMADWVIEYVRRYDDNNTLDYLIVTHSDLDHISYVDEIFDAFAIVEAYLPYVDIDDFTTDATEAEKGEFDGGMVVATQAYEKVAMKAFNEENCVVKCVKGNFKISIEEDITFDVFSLDKAEYNGIGKSEYNEQSPICLLTYARRTIVFTGDAEDISEDDFIEDCGLRDCDVLKVGHHGSKTSTSSDFLRTIGVEYAVISAGNHGSYNHPDAEVLERLDTFDIDWYCTRYSGTVVLTVDSTGTISFKAAIASVA